MNKTIVFIMFTILFINGTFSQNAPKPPAFTYLTLQRQWPGTVCKMNNCTAEFIGQYDSKNFNMHGLWPSGSQTDACFSPSECDSNNRLYYQSINIAAKKFVDTYWVGLYMKSYTFQNHEWMKHGTCHGADQNSYFNLASDLHKKFNPVSALAAKGIVPSNTVSYSANDIIKVLSQSFGGQVYISCEKINGQQYLETVDMYFNNKDMKLISQPCTKYYACSNYQGVYIPLIQY